MVDLADLEARVKQASATGMIASIWAELKPNDVAVWDHIKETSFKRINDKANQIVRLLRANGVVAGDAVALLCSNRAEFLEVLSAARRGGYRFTPVNWHLNADEANYVINDCEAKAFFGEVRFPACVEASKDAPLLKLKVALGEGATPAGFIDYEAETAKHDASDIPDPVSGGQMLYTSGTTGRPKGVYRPPSAAGAMMAAMMAMPAFEKAKAILAGNAVPDVQLGAGPAYHAAPLAFDVGAALNNGLPLAFIDKWDSEQVLKTIQDRKVTRAHLVPIMFQRLLAVPPETRAKYDISSLNYVIHGAAPCPPEVKHEMIKWLGPIINEYYAGSEGGGGFSTTSEEWLKKPGTVGKLMSPDACKILDDAGNEVPKGTPGTLYFKKNAAAPFEYFKDPEKTANAHRGDYFTLGDVGYLDDEDYLYLTGRSAEIIISGGVNIYPQEVDNELIKHDAVEDACTIGVPNKEWGEEVKAVIKLKPGVKADDKLKQDIIVFAKGKLAGFKVPRTIDFIEELPRNPAGKVERKKVRAGYWEGRKVQI